MQHHRQAGWVAWSLSFVLFVSSATALWFYSDKAQQHSSALNELADMQAKLRTQERLRTNAERSVESLENQRQEWRRLETELKSEIDSLSDDIDRLRTQLTQVQQAESALRLSLQEKEQALLDQEKTLQEKEDALSETQSNIALLENELSEAATTEELYLAAREQLALQQAENETYAETIARLQAEMAEEASAMAALEEQLQTQLSQLNQEKEQLVTQLEDGTTAIKLPESILFASGSALLSEEGKQALSVLGAALQSFPNHLISIQGHTDSQKISRNTALVYPSNWELSTARASSAVRELLNQGIPATQLQAVGFADTHPLVEETDSASRQQNRRIEVILYPNQFKTRLLDS